MKVLTEKLEALTLIVIDGNVASSIDSTKILDAITSVEEGHLNVILDLSQVDSFLESELLALETAQESIENYDKSFVLCGINHKLHSAINENFDEEFFNIVPSRNEAVDMVYLEEQERSFFN